MEWEATASRWVTELERQLESTQAVGLLVVEWAIAAKRGLEAAKVH